MSNTAENEQELDRARRELLELIEKETATTLKVLRAYPAGQSELKPHPVLKNARELAWMFTAELAISAAAVEGTMQLGKGMPPTPETLDDVIAAFELSRAKLMAVLKDAPASVLGGTVRFPIAPKQIGDFPILPFLRFMMLDQIHHRGQFSIYLRLAGGRMPSIYGPTADEPWR